MANVGQVYYNVIDDTRNGYATYPNGLDIFSDLVVIYGTRFTKVGIQAPPGTKVIMNENKTIMVGRTGIYELDEDISITSLRFDRPRRYEKDNQKSAELIEAGTALMKEADNERTQKMEQLKNKFPIPPTSQEDENYKAYWDEYNQIQSDYIKKYQEGLGSYNSGINGIYVLPNPNDPDDDINYQDLYNIIVDFIYE